MNKRDIIESNFSNADSGIFAITTPSQTDRGALMSRYSRTDKSMRDVFLDEFAGNPSRGEEFYRRVLGAYGDDSVAELGTAQIAVEGMSNIAAQTIEDRRIGLSFLEKSSRYVDLSVKKNGRYQYVIPNEILHSPYADRYIRACDDCFDAYAGIMGELPKFLFEEFFEDAGREKARRHALDIARNLLPASTMTNVGITGNGRSFEYLLSILLNSDLFEEWKIGEGMRTELQKIIGPFIRRSSETHGIELRKYLRNVSNYANTFVAAESIRKNVAVPSCRMTSYQDEDAALDNITRSFFRGYDRQGAVAGLSAAEKTGVIEALASFRQNRRHRPPRAFELTEYQFSVTTTFGTFRDIHRHRLLTMIREAPTARHGFADPAPVIDYVGFGGRYRECMEEMTMLYNDMRYDDARTDLVNAAQYATTFGHLTEYSIRMNLREAVHLTELRTGPNAHAEYHDLANQMLDQIRSVHPVLSKIIRFDNRQ